MDTTKNPMTNEMRHCFSIYMILEIAVRDITMSCTKYNKVTDTMRSFVHDESSINTLLLFQNRYGCTKMYIADVMINCHAMNMNVTNRTLDMILIP